jgi:hypothetical protein
MLLKLKTVGIIAGCALLLNSCAAQSSRQTTTEALTTILEGNQRAPENRARGMAISVGSVGKERRIVNVAAGRDKSDGASAIQSSHEINSTPPPRLYA